ncbi:MAG: type I phosphomannose isomerase catalytic subunit, partial [Chitinophagales bacterium]
MNILALQGVIQHYAWGGQRFIPELIAVDNNQQQPYAELWIGTHHKGPAMVQNQVPPMDLITFTAK